ncbi:MAG: DUF4358 domain-containing protein [Ruminococcus sp.]|nr:DUF4358 domain-containing protein [Ruminococcus sp.]
MKRCISIVLAAALFMFAFAGCGAAKEVDLKPVLTDINAKCADETANLKELTTVDELYDYYLISPADVKQFAAEINPDTSEAPVEIVMVEANDKSGAGKIKSALNSRFSSIKSTYSSYAPEKLDVIEKSGVTTKDNYVFMVVSEKYSDIMEVIDAAF